MSTDLSQRTGVILILCGALAVGLLPSAAKIAYQEGANPLDVLLVDERLNPIQWLGISLVIGSLMVLELPKKEMESV